MKETKFIVDVPEEVMKELERVHFEYTAIKDNILFLMETYKSNPSIIESETFKAYQKQQAEKCNEYEKIKDKVTLTYIPEDVLLAEKYSWTADFENNQLIITEA